MYNYSYIDNIICLKQKLYNPSCGVTNKNYVWFIYDIKNSIM